MSGTFVERERKFDVDPTFKMPDLTPALPAGSAITRSVQHLRSDYFDTTDHSLRRLGVTLRRRTGSDDTGWHLKLPHGDFREEVHADLATDPPEELTRLLLGITRGTPLAVIATLSTERQVTRVIGPSGDHVADVDLDHVEAIAERTSKVVSWTELEVELGSASVPDEQLTVLSRVIEDAGARTSDSKSKLQRAVGSIKPTRKGGKGKHGKHRTAGAVLLPFLGAQHRALLLGDLALRRGDASVIHSTRVATRRFRSVLRVFAPFFDPDRGALLDTELRWYAELLGDVRDDQVLEQRLDRLIQELPSELVIGPVQERIEDHLSALHARHWARLQSELLGARYLVLMEELASWIDRPPFTAAAARPERAVVQPVKRADKKVGTRLRAANKTNDIDLLHRARKSAKRARYAAEAVQPVVGPKAKQEAKRYEQLQDLLGEHQDSVVAGQLLLELGAAADSAPEGTGFTFGVLFQQEQDRAAEARRTARKVARKLR
ncbi:CYTH and CHAD domain-containing protein [Amnibacterium kyonggiense]|uniref:CHAD domain-containing protein n=1 Tax=Amnibacterium kyonggiense TaxID=595671 RepID=A0A4R7FP77_9MICO|nr:CYTH and CHAD domain-containing protein [Amnibacterium kyonggiense]TDS79493.1 CHAD domain-containing protein [Amnibacterium kyonggiense]